jgi:ISXO2-like transposase domain
MVLSRVADTGCDHVALPTGSGGRAAQHPSFQWVDTMLAKIKAAVVGTYKSGSKNHMVQTLAEFEWRFDHRKNPSRMIPVLACAGAHTKPKPYWHLKMADYGAQSGLFQRFKYCLSGIRDKINACKSERRQLTLLREKVAAAINRPFFFQRNYVV